MCCDYAIEPARQMQGISGRSVAAWASGEALSERSVCIAVLLLFTERAVALSRIRLASSQSLTTTRISRRASMVATLLAGHRPPTADAAACGTSPNDDLIELGRQFLETTAQEECLVAPDYRRVRFTYPPDVEARLEAIVELQADLRSRIAAQPAAAIRGLQAKARVVMMWLAPDGEVVIDETHADARLDASWCRDLLSPAA